MAEGKKAGTIIVELSLDATKYTNAQKEILAAAEKNSADIEQVFGRVGITSDKMYDAMRKSVQNSLAAIKQSHLTTAEEKIRAEQSAADKIRRITEEQFGKQAGLLDKMKEHWFATTAAIAAAWFAATRALDLVEKAAAYAESLDNLSMLTAKYNVSGRQMVDTIVANSTGLIRLGTAADVAAEAMSKGFTPEMLAKVAGWAPIIDDLSTSVGSSDEAFKMLIQTIASARERGVTQLLGATLDLKTAFGDQAENMSKAEKAMAMYEMVAARVTEIQKAGVGATDSYADKIERFRNQIDALRLTLGDVIFRLGAGLLSTFQSVSALALGLARVVMAPISALMLATDYLGITKGKFEQYKTDMEALGDAAQHTAEQAAANFELMRKGMQGGAPAKGSGVDLGFGNAPGGGGGGKTDPAMERRLREVARMYAEEGKLVHDALMAEMGMNQEYHDTIRKMDDETWEEQKRIAAEILKLDAKKFAEEGAMVHDALAAEMGMTQEYLDTARAMKKAEFEAWKEMHDPRAMAEFYDSIVGYEREAHDRKIALIIAERDARIKYGIDAVAANKKAEQDIQKLALETFQKKAAQVHQAFGDMAHTFSALSTMYKEGSKGQERMQEAAKAMIVLQEAVAVVNAVAAISAAAAAPFPAGFVAMASMAAAMGSLLGSIGASVGGGGAASAQALPASTVLGAEAGTGSESISKVWELLEDTYDLEYRELTGIHNSMKELNTNITALVTSIVRTGTVGAPPSGVNFGVTFGEAGSMFDTEGKTLWDKWMNVVGGWANSIFGGDVSKTLEGAGIEFKGISAGQLIAGEYLDALQYAVVKTVEDGGWFHSDKTSYQTIYEALDSDVSRLFNLVFQGMSTTLVELAKGLGTDVNAAMSYVFEGTRIDLRGKTGEETQKTLSEYFSKVGDEAVKALFGDLVAQYQQLNEELFETAARLVIDKAIVTEILTMTNQGLPGSTAQIIAFSESLIAMAGGLDVLQEASATYYDKFFTDAEKQARLQGQLSGAFGDLGMTLPGSRSGYRALVEGLDLTTEAGKEAYVALLKWSAAADEYYSAMEDNLGLQDDLTESLKKQSETIRNWLIDLNMSSLAPVVSMESYRAEYERQKAVAYAPGATEQDLSGFLNYSKEYLQFMRSYGGDYKAVYDAVVGDVSQLGDIKDAQVAAIETADAAARAAAADHTKLLGLVVQATTEQDPARLPVIREESDRVRFIPENGEWYYTEPETAPEPFEWTRPTYAAGGLTSGPSMAGEAGREWVVPTYEPQRSRFLESVPPAFWENLRGGGAVQGGGRPIEMTINNVTVLDGKVVARSVAKRTISDGDLAVAIRGVN